MNDTIMSKTLVSIVIPVYNTEQYLDACLESVCNQSHSNLEIIIVNDGSTDGSVNIIQNYSIKDNRIVVINKKNEGLGYARNSGLTACNGEFVCFIDSDDMLLSNYISELLMCFSMDPRIDIVVGDYLINYIDRKKPYPDYWWYPKNRITSNTLFIGDRKEKELVCYSIFERGKSVQGTLMCVWKNMYRLSFLKEKKLLFLSEREVYAEDYVFNVQAYYYANGVYITNSHQYVHNIISGSLSRCYRSNMLSMTKTRCNVLMSFLSNISSSNRNRMISNLELQIDAATAYCAYNTAYANNKTAKAKVKEFYLDSFIKRLYKCDLHKQPLRVRVLIHIIRLRNPFLATCLIRTAKRIIC